MLGQNILKLIINLSMKKVVNGDIQLKHIATHDQIPDVFTKGQSAARFQFLRHKTEGVFAPHLFAEGV